MLFQNLFPQISWYNLFFENLYAIEHATSVPAPILNQNTKATFPPNISPLKF